jgi:hypothetical protein
MCVNNKGIYCLVFSPNGKNYVANTPKFFTSKFERYQSLTLLLAQIFINLNFNIMYTLALVNQEFICVDSGVIFVIKDVRQKGTEPFIYYQSVWDETQKESSSISSFISKLDEGKLAVLPY